MQENCPLQQDHNEGITSTQSPSTASHYTITTVQEDNITPTAILTARNSYLAGYQDCMEEAMQYLAEVENLPQTDPLIVGLQQHLVEQHRLLATNMQFSPNIFSSENTDSNSSICNTLGTHDSMVSQTNIKSNYGLNAENSAIQESSDVIHAQSSSPSSSTSSQQELHTRIYAEISKLSDLRTSMSEDDEMDNDLDEDDTISDEEDFYEQDPFSEYAYQLALLVQNNPSVAGLTEELLSLLGNVPGDSNHPVTLETQSSED